MTWVVAFGLLSAIAFFSKRNRKPKFDDGLYSMKTLDDRLWVNVLMRGGRRPQKLKF